MVPPGLRAQSCACYPYWQTLWSTDPGASCPPVPPLRLQVGSLPHSDKPTLLVRGYRLSCPESSRSRGQQPYSSTPVSAVVPETPDVQQPAGAVPAMEADVAPELIEASDEGSERHPDKRPSGEAGKVFCSRRHHMWCPLAPQTLPLNHPQHLQFRPLYPFQLT